MVVGREPHITHTVLRLLNGQPGWRAVGALTDAEAEHLFRRSPADLVLIGGGVDEASEIQLQARCRQIKCDTRFVRHYGGGSGLLFGEIRHALEVEDGNK